jgi:hypothetical protein
MNDDDREIAQVTQFMKGVARAMEREAVPDAGAVWTGIQLAERQRLAERAQLPARLAWMFAKFWLVFGVGLIVYLDWPVIGDFLLTLHTSVYVAIAAAVTIVFRARRLLARHIAS